MEVRKAKAPDRYMPTVVKDSSAERFPSVHRGSFEDQRRENHSAKGRAFKRL